MTLTPDRTAPVVGSIGVAEIASTAAELGNRLTAWAASSGHDTEVLRGSAALLSQAALVVALDAVGRSRCALERIEVELVREALDRGLPREQGLSAVNWVRTTEGATTVPPDEARVARTVRIATGANHGPDAVGERLVHTWYAGALSMEKADQILRLATDAIKITDPEQLADTIEVLRAAAIDGPDPLAAISRVARGGWDGAGGGSVDGEGTDAAREVGAHDEAGSAFGTQMRNPAVPSWVTGMAPDPDLPWTLRTGTGPDNWGLTGRDLRTAIGYTRRMLKPADLLQEEAAAARRGRALRARPGLGGLTDYQLTVDADGAALIDAAVAAFSIPRPATPDGTADLRSAAHRRADALLEVVQRGLNATREGPGLPAGQPKAQVVVTIGLSDLLASTNGAGITSTGQVLTPDVVRRIACDAGIVPMILDGAGQPLDVGRGRRFFTDAQRVALFGRDRHCTFPGCTIPAQWCDAHHVTPWAEGGRTDLTAGALLCRLHHTLVHDRGLTATVTRAGVRWHLRP